MKGRLGKTVVLMAALSVFAGAAYAAPNIVQIGDVDGGPNGQGRVYAGGVPVNVDYTKPVLVFVHGLGGSAYSFTAQGGNAFYDLAYNEGYRTAFVSMNDESGNNPRSVLDCGNTLNRQLDVILSYYGVLSVNIIAGSKGGPDVDAALVYWGGSVKVQNVVMMASPNKGTQLADNGSLVGQNTAGVQSMKTSYMNSFRSMVAGSPHYQNFRIYTAGGTNWGRTFSQEWMAASLLWNLCKGANNGDGSNDSVVPLYSTIHPNQSGRIGTFNFTHAQMMQGSNMWNAVKPYISSAWRTSPIYISTTSAPSANYLRSALMLKKAGKSLKARPQKAHAA